MSDARSTSTPAGGGANPHPHFDDRGTLDWHIRWKDAAARAARESKLVFVEFGREA